MSAGVFLIVSLMVIFPSVFLQGGQFSRSPQSMASASGLFENNTCLDILIVASLDSLFNDLGENPSYHDARLSYLDNDGSWYELPVEIRTRGNFRQNPVNCDFPPFKLRFDKKYRMNTIFQDYKTIKMVTHCQTNIPAYEQYLLQEYLIYKTYNIITPVSFKVRLLKVVYQDNQDEDYRIEKFAFFIEDSEDMATRLNGQMLNLATIIPGQVNQEQYAILSFFEYMIINTDWSLPILHNVELLSLNYFEPPFPVPFDFDWAGIINIPYQVPTVAGLKEREPERVYNGNCLKKNQLNKIIRLYHSRKQEIFDLYSDFPYLDENYKTSILQEFQVFYQVLNDKYLFRTEFLDRCK